MIIPRTLDLIVYENAFLLEIESGYRTDNTENKLLLNSEC